MVTIGWVLSGIHIFTALSTLLGPLLVRHFGYILSVTVTQVLSVPFLLTAAYAPMLWGSVFSLMFRGALTNMGRPLVASFFMKIVAAEERAIINSLQRMMIYFPRGIGTALGGLLMARYGYQSPYIVYSFILFGSALFYYWAFFVYEKKSRLLGLKK
jgi:predicted MFS family arabinose efflux permease